MRKRLIAIPYSAAKYGVRVDWSPLSQRFIWYFWTPKGLGTARRSRTTINCRYPGGFCKNWHGIEISWETGAFW